MYFFFHGVRMTEENKVIKEYFGYAVCDKENSSRELKVYSSSLLPLHVGTLKATEASVKIATTGNGKNAYSGEVCESNYITCKYRDDSSNHTMFPPDVRAGEQVTIFQIGDDPQYWWKPCARTEGNRRTERHRIAISDTCENATDLDDENTYYIELDTRNNHRIVISTNKADGEEFKYQLNIDADKNQIYLGDDIGNGILINSKTQSVIIRSSSGATMQCTANDMNSTCKGNFTLHIDGNVKQTVEGDVSLSCDGNVSISSKGSITLKSSSKIDLIAPTINVKKGG